MLNVRLAGDHLYGKIAVHLAVASDVFDGAFLCCPVSHEMSWIRSGTELSKFLSLPCPLLWSTRAPKVGTENNSKMFFSGALGIHVHVACTFT